MAYSAEINRNNPACFLFLVDLSSSMLEPFGAQPEKSKAEGVADAINRLLSNLVIKCTKSEGVRDYFNVGVVSYGGRVLPALGGALDGLYLVPVSKIAEHPLRLEKRQRRVPDGAGGFIETSIKFPVWFDPKAAGRTPMCAALTTAQAVLKKFIEQYPKAFPPIVVNITDGMATDGDPVPPAQALQALATQDGKVLLFNAHVSEKDVKPIEFPAAEAGLPDNFALALFRMSSTLPPQMLEAAKAENFPVQAGSRGFVFNADLVSVIRFLDIGTRVAQPPAGGAK
jgi:hypothetical protein